MYTKTAILHNVPHEDLLYIQLRENSCTLFQILRDKLNQNPVVVITQDNTITVPTGKSALAAQYVRKVAYAAYRNIIWLDVANTQTYQKSLQGIDRTNGEELFKKHVLNGECLIIIDNANNKEFVEEIISLVKNGKDNEVIIITRNDSLYTEKNKIYLSTFSLENTIKLGIMILKKHYSDDEENYFHLLMEFISFDVYKLRNILFECITSGIGLKLFVNDHLKSGILRFPRLLQARKGITNMEDLSGKDYANFSEEFWKNDEVLMFKVAVDFMHYLDGRKLNYSYVSSHFDSLISEMLAEFTIKLSVHG